MFKKSEASQRLYLRSTPRLKVSESKHTGRLLPHSSTSYPVLAMIMLCVGVLLSSWTSLANADLPSPGIGSYNVTVMVKGPPPKTAADIDSPTSGAIISGLPITVSGDCPVDTYEKLLVNGIFSGIGLCSAEGAFTIQTGLFKGSDRLVVQDFNFTDVGGPLSQAVQVNYKPVRTVSSISSFSQGSNTSSSSTSLTTTNLTEPLVFKTNYTYQGYYVGQAMQWQIDIEGGTAPYAVSVDWGDGSHGLISRPSSGDFDLTHVYKKAGGYKGSYNVSLTASDANNQQTYLQLIAIINSPPITSGGTSSTPNNGFFQANTASQPTVKFEKYVWSGYGVVVLMISSFWLGGRQEFKKLKPIIRKSHKV